MGHQFLIETRAKAESNPRPSAYQRNALPQGQSVSLHKYLIHCGGTRSQTHSVHESQHSTRTGEPKRNRTYVPLLTSLTPFRWAKPAHYTKGEECCLFDRTQKTKTTVWKFKRKAPIRKQRTNRYFTGKRGEGQSGPLLLYALYGVLQRRWSSMTCVREDFHFSCLLIFYLKADSYFLLD